MKARTRILYFDANAGAAAPRRQDDDAALCGNPASAHVAGQRAKGLLEEARETMAELLGVNPDRLVFTSGGTESVTTALFAGYRPADRPILQTGAADHPGTRANAANISGFAGGRMQRYPVDSYGRLAERPPDLAQTSVLSVQAAHSETGAVLEPAAAKQLLGGTPEERNGAYLHVDACQLLGKGVISDWFKIADMVSLSGHKIGAPPGIGLLFLREGLDLRPLLAGEQEWRRRGGTPNLPGALAFARAAASRLSPDVIAANQNTWRQQTARIRHELSAIFPDIEWLSPETGVLPQTLFFRIPGIRSQQVLMFMDRHGVCLSAGTACRSGLLEPNETLLALGYPEDAARETIRVSLDWATSDTDVDRLIELFASFQQIRNQAR